MAKYRYSRSSSPFEEAKNTYIMIGICAVVVIAALILCLTLQRDTAIEDVPVVEQGDGAEALPDYSQDQITSIGDIIVDDGGAPVEEFTVTVTGADGLYRRSGEGEEASLTVSGQTAESFGFDLTVAGSSLNGTAYFISERSAICEKAEGAITFSFDAGAVYVRVDGVIGELGEASAEGLYDLIEAAPTTTTASTEETASTTSTAAASGSYDLDVINSDAVQSELTGMMSTADFNLMNDLLGSQGGYGVIHGTGDSSKEKEGRQFNYDSGTDSVVYYAFESGTGREVVVLCSSRGEVYVGVCDGSEYRYYTSDPERKSAADAPNYIATYASNKHMSLEAQ